ncbi:MAG: ABC transporter substrate-binding protein [Christensenellaceae bacterium]
MKKKLVIVMVVALACIFAFASCAKAPAAPAATQAPAATEAPAAAATEAPAAPEAPAADLSVQVVAKGFQHQFWQVVKKGAEAAATDLGVKMTFNGPEGESAINTQVEMLNTALAANPSAIALAALDTKSVASQLEQAKAAGIPIIGFDSGVPDAPEGSIAATASTDNEAAAALASDEMMKDAKFSAALKAATPEKPVYIGVLSQDATSASIIGRTKGFVDAMKAAAEETFPGAVAVEGHDNYKMDAASKPAVIIQVNVPPTPDAADMKNGAQAMLNTKNLVGVFCSNEGAVTGFLNATNDGADLDREKGKYKEMTVAGFDAGKTQKSAVTNGWFLGAVTQDPYQIGYQAVELAVKAALGEKVADVDTGAKWYNAANITDPAIADLVYD